MPQKKHLHLSKCFVLLALLIYSRSNRFWKDLKKFKGMKKPLFTKWLLLISKFDRCAVALNR